MNDELELLSLRAAFLSGLVDRVVVGESSFTFSGLPKPKLVSDLGLTELSGTNLSVITVPDDLLSDSCLTRWQREQRTRNYVAETCAKQFPDSVIILSDVDEVPSIAQVKRIRCSRLLALLPALSLPMKDFERRADFSARPSWARYFKVKVFPAKRYRKNLRYRPAFPILAKPGVHVSFLNMSPKEIRKKYSSYSHEELDTPFASSSQILDYCNRYLISARGNFEKLGNGCLTLVPFDKLPAFCRFVSERSTPNRTNSVGGAVRKFDQLCASFRLTRALQTGADKVPPTSFHRLDEGPPKLSESFEILLNLFLQRVGYFFARRAVRHVLWGDPREERLGMFAIGEALKPGLTSRLRGRGKGRL